MRAAKQSGALNGAGGSTHFSILGTGKSQNAYSQAIWVSERRGGGGSSTPRQSGSLEAGGRREYTFRYFGPLKVPKCVLAGNLGL